MPRLRERSPLHRLHQPQRPPMPARLPPFVLEGPHEVKPELDVDWTRCPEDWEQELRLRKVRNEMIKEKLLAGKTVCFRSSGGSLRPRVRSNDQTTFEPVTIVEQVQVDDIVFCEVQPGDRFYAHLVKRKEFIAEWEGGAWVFTISNIWGRENGWCTMKHIYGKLTQCVH